MAQYEIFHNRWKLGLNLRNLPPSVMTIWFESNLAQQVLVSGTAVDESLRDHRETRVDNRRLIDIEHKLGILYHIHPETQR